MLYLGSVALNTKRTALKYWNDLVHTFLNTKSEKKMTKKQRELGSRAHGTLQRSPVLAIREQPEALFTGGRQTSLNAGVGVSTFPRPFCQEYPEQ